MPWKDFFKRKSTNQQPNAPATPEPPQQQATSAPLIVGKRPPVTDPQARERRRRRLEQRIKDLQYDIAQAEEATGEHNRWTERIAGIEEAIEQARRDVEAALAIPPGRAGIPLPPLPVTVQEVQPQEPATVRFQIGDEVFAYQEEIDWAERGTQKAPGLLVRQEGEIDALVPPDIPADRRDELREHLAHSLGTLAEQLRDEAMAGQPHPTLTLADLARPCPECGGWRDLRGRCPACQERQWRADALRADAERLMKERNEQLEDLQRMRERLPILRVQLADAQADLARFGDL
jgi:hypothetical protein